MLDDGGTDINKYIESIKLSRKNIDYTNIYEKNKNYFSSSNAKERLKESHDNETAPLNGIVNTFMPATLIASSVTNPIAAIGAVTAGIGASYLGDKVSQNLTGRTFTSNWRDLIGASNSGALLTNPLMWIGGGFGAKKFPKIFNKKHLVEGLQILNNKIEQNLPIKSYVIDPNPTEYRRSLGIKLLPNFNHTNLPLLVTEEGKPAHLVPEFFGINPNSILNIYNTPKSPLDPNNPSYIAAITILKQSEKLSGEDLARYKRTKEYQLALNYILNHERTSQIIDRVKPEELHLYFPYINLSITGGISPDQLALTMQVPKDKRVMGAYLGSGIMTTSPQSREINSSSGSGSMSYYANSPLITTNYLSLINGNKKSAISKATSLIYDMTDYHNLPIKARLAINLLFDIINNIALLTGHSFSELLLKDIPLDIYSDPLVIADLVNARRVLGLFNNPMPSSLYKMGRNSPVIFTVPSYQDMVSVTGEGPLQHNDLSGATILFRGQPYADRIPTLSFRRSANKVLFNSLNGGLNRYSKTPGVSLEPIIGKDTEGAHPTGFIATDILNPYPLGVTIGLLKPYQYNMIYGFNKGGKLNYLNLYKHV